MSSESPNPGGPPGSYERQRVDSGSSPANSSTPAPAKPRTGAYVAVAVLVLAGQGLLGAALVAQLRQKENAPPATVLSVPAWAVATAGLVSTLAGGLWLRKLV